jgi:hypothetical protein
MVHLFGGLGAPANRALLAEGRNYTIAATRKTAPVDLRENDHSSWSTPSNKELNMNRRAFITSVAATVASPYIWIPRIAFAQTVSIDQAHDVLVNAFDQYTYGSPTKYVQDTSFSSSHTQSTVKKSIETLGQKQYVDYSSKDTELSYNQEKQQVLFGADRTLDDGRRSHCHAYVHPNRPEEAIAYIVDIPFICHAAIVKEAIKHWSSDQIIDYLYPSQTVEYYTTIWEAATMSEPPEIYVYCARGVWIAKYSGGNIHGNGQCSLMDRQTRNYIYQVNLQYDGEAMFS